MSEGIWIFIQILLVLIGLVPVIFGLVYVGNCLVGMIDRRLSIDRHNNRKLEVQLALDYNEFEAELRNRPKQLQAPIQGEPCFEHESWRDRESDH